LILTLFFTNPFDNYPEIETPWDDESEEEHGDEK